MTTEIIIDPDQPRRFFEREAIELEATIQSVGQLTPIRVRVSTTAG